jgi:hypothetical protein
MTTSMIKLNEWKRAYEGTIMSTGNIRDKIIQENIEIKIGGECDA